MAEKKKFYNLREAADVLGVPPAEVNRMRERNELHAYRDGADWKFKVEQVEDKLAQIIRERGARPADEESADVLLSEQEFGESGPSASGTVIGPPTGASADSDIQLVSGESDIELAGSNVDLTGGGVGLPGDEEDSRNVDDLDLTLDEDLTLEDSVPLGGEAKPAGGSDASAVDFSEDEGLDDDDLVLGGSGSGSDITIGGDSGISLVDPADSGLSLEDPLDLGAGEESLELGEDDMLTLSEGVDTESPTELKAGGDFDLTPAEEADEDDESGSQVIALDTEGEADEAGMFLEPGEGGMAAMLDEDETPTDQFDLGAGAPALTPAVPPSHAAPDMAMSPGPAVAAGPSGAAAAGPALPEAPYSVGTVISLAACVVFLALTGMMCFDLMRHMWSWDAPYSLNSSLMDMILGLVGG